MPSLLGKSASDAPDSSEHRPLDPHSSMIYEFEDFRLDPANRLLTSEGKEIVLPGRAFDVLLMLVRRPRALLTKEELLASIWHGSFVEEANLTVAISTVRRALNEDPHERRFIQTVARRGYRFIAEVHEADTAPVLLPEPATIPLPPSSPAPSVEDQILLDVPEAVATTKPEHSRILPVSILMGGLLFALALGFWLVLKPREPIHTLAVLPLTTPAGRPDATGKEFVLLGVTDALISRLEGDLIVRPTSSVLRYSEGSPPDPVAAGREQGVDAVLLGSMEDVAGKTELKLRLLRVRDGFTMWQDSFQAPSSDLPQLEQDAGESAGKELRRLGAVSAPAIAKPAGNSVMSRANDPAYQLYLRGRYFWNRRTVEGLRKSTDYFRQSIAADPNYAPAYAGLADSYALLASFSVEPGSSANADARSAALSAIQLDPTLAEPHASLGMIYFFTDWNLAAAQKEFERAIKLDPNYATAHHWYALDLAAMGLPAQALYEIHLAQKLDPLSLIIGTNVGWIEYLTHDYPAATRDLHRVLELDSNFVRARTRLGMVEMMTGDQAAAIADLTQALALSGDEDPWVMGLLGDAQALSGDKTAAEHTLAELKKRSASQYVPPISRGLVLLGLGRKAEALAALKQSEQDHSTAMVYARVDPLLDPLRGDPEFQALLDKLKP
jgi:DNA-binding winged helix-turn-helix (wHTH) protein/tetratricopeptide (TPR) repeat protein/TolB-like protein